MKRTTATKAILAVPLNLTQHKTTTQRPPVEVSADLRRLILNLYGSHITDDGRKVDYEGLGQDPAFHSYVEATGELQCVDLDSLNREESMCFWINMYNALVVHATVVGGAPSNALERIQFFGSASYNIARQRFTLNDIEHGILRGNAPKPTSLLSLVGLRQFAAKTFGRGDPRRALAITPIDPRIHFALNCGATSCPPIRVYTPDRLELGLESAARAFCVAEVRVDVDQLSVTLSSILKWYGGDFGTKTQLLKFLTDHVPDDTKAQLQLVIERGGPDAQNVTLKYFPYNWNPNKS